MRNKPNPENQPKGAKTDRSQRLAQQLRTNLEKRKDQARARKKTGEGCASTDTTQDIANTASAPDQTTNN